MSDDSTEDDDEEHHDFEDFTADHHFGMKHPDAGSPYNNRGRSEGVWQILAAYGFRKITDTKGKSSFDGPIPNPCFELVVRDCCTRDGKPDPQFVKPNGELMENTVAEMARRIRSSHQIDYLEDAEKQSLQQMDDANGSS